MPVGLARRPGSSSCLVEHRAGLEIGDDEDVGLPGHRRGDAPCCARRPARRRRRTPAARRARRRRSGRARPSWPARPPRPRSAARVDGLDRRQDRHLRLLDAEARGEVDGVLHDVALGGEVGLDVERRVGDEQRPRIARHVHDEDVAHPARRCRSPVRGGGDDAAAAPACAASPSSARRRGRRARARPRSPRPRGCARWPRSARPAMSISCASAAARMRSSRPTSTGTISPACAAWTAPSSASRSTGMHDRDADRLEALGARDQLAEVGAVVVQVDLGQRDPRAADLVGRRDHDRDALDHRLVALVDAAAVERDPVALGVLLRRGDRDRDRVAERDRARGSAASARGRSCPGREAASRAASRSARRPTCRAR